LPEYLLGKVGDILTFTNSVAHKLTIIFTGTRWLHAPASCNAAKQLRNGLPRCNRGPWTSSTLATSHGLSTPTCR
jgi:hypothetical protein